MKRCPFCDEEIQDAAVKCKHCGELLTPRAPTQDDLDKHVTIPSAGAARPGRAVAPEDDLDRHPTTPGASARYDTLDNAATQQKGPTILGGQYRILKKLGKGGMGVVYLAEDMEMEDRLVAIKVLPPELSDNVRAVENLRREAMTAINLTHPNIIRLQSFHSDHDMKYMVMEYVDGQTLEQRLAESKDGKLSVNELLTIMEKVAAALDYAHSRKQPVFHRDLKPSNIMISKDGEVRLMDFGIAREMKDSYTSVTGKQDASGTLPYMSPEQVRGKRPSGAMDIYSLGVVCYECLSGKPPFHTGELTYQILHEGPEPLESASSDVNEALQQALAKDASGRPATASELVRMLAGRGPRQAQHPIAMPPKRLVLPSDLIEVGDAKYAPLEGLAPGSREAQERQRRLVETQNLASLPLEFKTARTGIVFRLIPPGTFVMGSPDEEEDRQGDETQHEVTLTKPFYCAGFPVTQSQWQAVMGENPSHFKKAGKDAPVEQVSWEDCQTFVKKLCQMEGVPEEMYRLLTEAEWEYACRAGTVTPSCYGNDLDASMANFDGNYPYGSGRKGQYRETTVRVGMFRPNGWGLYDMHGNVYEWCQDWYAEYPSGSVTDPLGPRSGVSRVRRGGGWLDDAWFCRSADRDRDTPGGRSDNVGLRLARITPSYP